MPAKIRLQRHGKKGQPFYHIVIADGRSPRDGRFIEKIGTYDPLQQPAKIVLNFDKALYWYSVGAVPTDTVRSLLSKKGVMLKYHLLCGVKKGAMTEEQAEIKFQTWLKDKEAKDAGLVKTIQDKARGDKKVRLESETKVNEARAAEIAKKRVAEMEAKRAAEEAAQAETEAQQATAAVQEEQAPVDETPATEAPAENTEA